MGRIRTIKPDFFNDEDIAALPLEARLVYIGLWTQADKAGRLEDRPRRLKALVAPYDNWDFDVLLARLEEARFIIRYEVSETRYIQVRTWAKHQRPHHTETESDIPPPVGEITVSPPLLNGEVPDGKERKGRDRKGVVLNVSPPWPSAQPWFDRVYAAYPNKARRNAALALWHRDIADEATATAILADVQARVANGWVRIERRFIPQLLTYLEERQWEDAPQTEPVTDTRLHDLPVAWCCQTCGGIHETPAGERLTCRKALEALEPPSIPFSELVARHAAKATA